MGNSSQYVVRCSIGFAVDISSPASDVTANHIPRKVPGRAGAMEGTGPIRGCNILHHSLLQRHPMSDREGHGYLGTRSVCSPAGREDDLITSNLIVGE